MAGIMGFVGRREALGDRPNCFQMWPNWPPRRSAKRADNSNRGYRARAGLAETARAKTATGIHTYILVVLTVEPRARQLSM
eukprot:1928080-Heterocapsa_arctica.AAC.1